MTMPARTTPFQMTVHFLRQHWADADTIVTESAMLLDRRLNIQREVDVTVEGHVDGEPVLISFEVIEHGRPGDITWVEQMITKHRYLPTNRLVLVSKSGFSANAVAAASAEGGWVATVEPETIEVDGQPVVKELFVGTVQLRFLRGTFIVALANPDETPQIVADTAVSTRTGETLGTADVLAQEILRLPWVGQHLLRQTYDHPERDKISHFTLGIDVAPLELRARLAEDEDREILRVELVGELDFAIEPLTLATASLSGRRFVSGTARLLGKDTLWVGTDNPDGEHSTMSIRTLDNTPLIPNEAQPAAALAAHLARLEPPPEWTEDAGALDDGAPEPPTVSG
jgi:hypothetical protein